MHAPAPQHPAARAAGRLGELRALLALGAPIALVQLGMMAMNAVDIGLLGHYRAEALAAMSVGNTLSWAALVFGMGVLTAADPLLSQATGASDDDGYARVLLRSLWLAVLLALPAMALLLPADTLLLWLGQRPELVPDAAAYARINTLGFLPFLWFHALRQGLSARGSLRPQVVTILLGNLLNAGADWVLIFGHLGLPELGVHGAAWATVCCRWLMALCLLGLGWRTLGPALRTALQPLHRARALAWRGLGRLLRLGLPVGAQFALEMGVFAATALLVATFGDAEAGGHQVAIQLASMSFMVPLGLGSAAAVRVGWAIGRNDAAAARRSAGMALAIGALVMAGFAALFLLLPRPLAHLFTDQPGVLAQAALLLPIAGVFQLGDGVQVVAIGCLRGAGDTRSPVLCNVVGFWVLGLPLGCVFGFSLGHGPQGLWWGLVVGLWAVALALLVVVRARFSGEHVRLQVD